MSSIRPSTVVVATVGTAATALLAYAFYFDYKRRNDAEFRRALKRESRREARLAKNQAEAAGAAQREAIKAAIAEAKEEGFPSSVEEKEAYFMTQVAEGEHLSTDSSSALEAALCFYKALKVYPQPSDLISIYDKTVPKPVLDILAEMIALDPVGGSSSERGSEHGVDD